MFSHGILRQMLQKPSFAAIITQKKAQPPRPPKGKRPKIWEQEDPPVFDPSQMREDYHARGRTFWMEYVDSKGQESARAVRLQNYRVSSSGKLILGGYCFLRNQTQTFHAERIQKMFWLDTGELVESPEAFFSLLCEPEKNEAFCAALWPELMILAHVARCDGFFHPEESEIMADFVEWQMTEPKRDAILRHVRSLSSTDEDIETALIQIEKRPKERKHDLSRHVRMLCDADGLLQAEEAAWAMRIAEALGA